jgi:DNA replication protein DnaC
MSTVALQQLREQLYELEFDFLPDNLETLLHEQSHKERPLVEALTSLLDCEITQRRQRAAKMRLKLSRVPNQKTLQSFESDRLDGITATQLNELATRRYIEHKDNVVFMGPSGLGKTHLLTALCRDACLAGHTAYFLTCTELVEQLTKAKHNMRLKRKLATLSKPHLLAIDEVGYHPMSREEAHLFFELIAARYERGTIILSTNKTFGQWAELMSEQAIATASLDRLLHHAHVFVLKGESYRLKDRMKLGLVPRTQQQN